MNIDKVNEQFLNSQMILAKEIPKTVKESVNPLTGAGALKRPRIVRYFKNSYLHFY